MFSFSLIWYFILTVASGLCLLYRIIAAISSSTVPYFKYFDTYLLAAGFAYFLITTITQIRATDTDKGKAGFVQKYLGKYFIILAIGCLFLANIAYGIVKIIKGENFFYDTRVLGYIDNIIVEIAIPICCAIDLFINPRESVSRLLWEMVGLIGLLIAFFLIEWGVSGYGFGTYFTTYWAQIIFRPVFSVLGYFVYEFIVKKRGGQTSDYKEVKN